jgi:hypothetical protein
MNFWMSLEFQRRFRVLPGGLAELIFYARPLLFFAQPEPQSRKPFDRDYVGTPYEIKFSNDEFVGGDCGLLLKGFCLYTCTQDTHRRCSW